MREPRTPADFDGKALPAVAEALRFHWMFPKGGEFAMKTPGDAARYQIETIRPESLASSPDMEGWTAFAHAAEQAGIESALISFSRVEPDALLVAGSVGLVTERLKFIVAHRSGLSTPTTFVQQINTLSAFLRGRVAINLVAGSSVAEQHSYGDFLNHDERYARAEEYLEACHAFWRRGASKVDFEGKYYRIEQGSLATPFFATERSEPEIYISGHSPQAERLALAQGSCWLRGADTLANLAPIVARARARGVEVGLRLCILSRSTRQEAIETAESLVPYCETGMLSRAASKRDDSTMYRQSEKAADDWLSPVLWTRLVRLCGPIWATFVGTPDEIADTLIEYKRIGVSQFILASWPEIDEVRRFGEDVLPRVRERERLLAPNGRP